jgi:cytosine/adenosine deaminase-related metal-dependent hydrolase
MNKTNKPDSLKGAADTLKLRYLAGLNAMLTYRDKDASKVLDLAQALIKVILRTLLSFALDIPQNIILIFLACEVMI